MNKTHASLAIAAAIAVAIPALAQMTMPGAPDASRVAAGSYKVDNNHTQVFWTLNHLGITPLSGAFAATGGSLDIDPAKPSAAKVAVTFDVAGLIVTAPAFAKHLSTPDLFDTAKFPTATFTSTSVQSSGNSATITGDLTIKGITKPITLDAKLYGAGVNMMSKKLNVGFTATGTLKRSDFGLGYGVPAIADQVDLKISAAFERVG